MKTLTEQAKIELLATKVMGWTLVEEYKNSWWDFNDPNKNYYRNHKKICVKCGTDLKWNPYQDWNHTYMVLNKVEKDKEMFKTICCDSMGYLRDYLGDTKEQLMDAVISLITI